MKIVPVILSGGSGTRLWPMSRDSYPKQFIGVLDTNTPLIRETLQRISDVSRFELPLVVGNYAHRFLLAEQLRRSGIESPEIMIEPCARNTAPAIVSAALYVKKRYGDALMLVLPTDQAIADTKAFLAAVDRAAQIAMRGYLVTFGVTPDYAETGYGYIRAGKSLEKEAYAIEAFVEKPDRAKAEGFIAQGGYFWNSGMFMFPTDVLLTEMDVYQDGLTKACRAAFDEASVDLGFLRLDSKAFETAPAVSIDYGLMEHTKRAAMVTLDCGWSDTGAWDLLWQKSARDAHGNVSYGDCYPVETHDSYLRSEYGPAIATFGVDNLVVVSTKDVVLVAAKDRAQSLKTLIEYLKEKAPALVQTNSRVYRPWGMYETLSLGPRYQVKHITVNPGGKLSLQMHKHRAEHWVIVSGKAKVTCDDTETLLSENESVYIPLGSKHRIENADSAPLQIIEVQSGSYLGEDDIVRFDDVYGRKGER